MALKPIALHPAKREYDTQQCYEACFPSVTAESLCMYFEDRHKHNKAKGHVLTFQLVKKTETFFIHIILDIPLCKTIFCNGKERHGYLKYFNMEPFSLSCS